MNGIDFLTIHDFIPLLNRSFFLRVGGFTVRIRLVEVVPGRGRSTNGAGRDPFQLTFVGPAQPLLSQSIYTFSTEDGLDLSMFLVPVDRVDGGIIYQAVYN